MWRDDPATTMVIGWHQESGQYPVLHYDEIDGGVDPAFYNYQQEPDRKIRSKGMNNRFVRLENLRSNTVYYFLLADSDGCSKRYSFKTAPDNAYERLSIVAGGDSRNYRKARRNANKLVAKLSPDCVMFGGDMTGGDTAKEWLEWFDDWQHTVRADGRMTPIIVARGNHEYNNASLYELFDTPNDKLFYALNLGGDLLRIYT
ncbi:MAG: phosphodiesterase/alkaline phosphatase D-like protein, partial [Polaribacter sp.]